jgi:iron complex transport system substrate-binding protein
LLNITNPTNARSIVSLLVLGIVLLSGPAAPQGITAAPQRVVSLGVCADQLLLALADPIQIASLSSEAGNPTISFLADLAASHPQGAGGVEALVGYLPDLVLADGTTSPATLELVEALGYATVQLQSVADIDEAIAQILLVGGILGREAEGQALADLVDAARRQATRTNWGDTVVSIRQDGEVSDANSFMTNLLAVIGLNNVGSELSSGAGRVSLEALVATPPTYLVVPDTDSIVFGGGLAVLQHPALAYVFPPALRLIVPDRLTHCAGPSLPVALRRLASELARVTP